ncbi:MAG: hypothetical protein ACREPP_08815 [Rhodanobacteraceae bacterium]
MQTLAIHGTFKSILWVALATALLLLVPLLAMRFTGEVQWTALDFAVAGALLFAAGLSFVLLTRSAGNIAYRLAAAIAVAAALMLVWGNLAVGLIGSENNPANLMYAGVIAIEIIGALVACGRSRGMSRALFATAIAQALVAVVALVGGLGANEPPGWLGILVLNVFFVALFAASAWLFARSARSNR